MGWTDETAGWIGRELFRDERVSEPAPRQTFHPPAPSGRTSVEFKAAKALLSSLNTLEFDAAIFVYATGGAGKKILVRLFEIFLGIVGTFAEQYANGEVWPVEGGDNSYYEVCSLAWRIQQFLNEVNSPA